MSALLVLSSLGRSFDLATQSKSSAVRVGKGAGDSRSSRGVQSRRRSRRTVGPAHGPNVCASSPKDLDAFHEVVDPSVTFRVQSFPGVLHLTRPLAVRRPDR